MRRLGFRDLGKWKTRKWQIINMAGLSDDVSVNTRKEKGFSYNKFEYERTI
jgi:hypothetical protein